MARVSPAPAEMRPEVSKSRTAKRFEALLACAAVPKHRQAPKKPQKINRFMLFAPLCRCNKSRGIRRSRPAVEVVAPLCTLKARLRGRMGRFGVSIVVSAAVQGYVGKWRTRQVRRTFHEGLRFVCGRVIQRDSVITPLRCVHAKGDARGGCEIPWVKSAQKYSTYRKNRRRPVMQTLREVKLKITDLQERQEHLGRCL